MKISDFIDNPNKQIDDDLNIIYEYDDSDDDNNPEIDMSVNIDNDDAQTYMNIILHGCTDIINIFRQFYCKLYNVNDDIFVNIDYDKLNSTNRWMEVLMEHMEKYNTFDNELHDVNNVIDVENYDELFVLIIDGIQKMYSQSLISIIKYLAQQDWQNIHWNIIPLK